MKVGRAKESANICSNFSFMRRALLSLSLHTLQLAGTGYNYYRICIVDFILSVSQLSLAGEVSIPE
jgi:hypothetical protein